MFTSVCMRDNIFNYAIKISQFANSNTQAANKVIYIGDQEEHAGTIE